MVKDKGYIVLGWDGVIARRDLAKVAHKKWFDFMIEELGDENLKEYVGSPDYFNHVIDITSRFLGVKKEGNERLLSAIARNLYEGFYLSESRGKERVWSGVKEVMEGVDRRGYVNVIVSGTPWEAVFGIVNQEGLRVDEHNIAANCIMEKPKSKTNFLRELLGVDNYKPSLYVGSGSKDIQVAKDMNIPAVLACWVGLLIILEGLIKKILKELRV